MQPLVSVLMAVYNNARYLPDAVESILNQTWSDFEFLIIDDGSTDDSWQLLQRYAAIDPRIQISRQENRGIPKTRNELLAKAQGEFMAIVDGDDITLPERLARQVEFLQQHPEVVCVGGAFDRIDEKGRLIDHYDPPQTDAEIQALLLSGTSILLHPCAMVRRSAMLQVGGYNETMVGSADLDLWLRLGEIGQLVNLPDTLLKYRLHWGSITYQRQNRQTLDAQNACARAWKRRGIQGQFTRPPNDPLADYQFLLYCGWMGFNRGQRQMAIDYGWQAVLKRPWTLDSWRLLICALVKPLPEVKPV